MDGEDNDRITTAYRRLGGVAGSLGAGLDAAAAGQDMLDFLAMLAGLKPVLLIGRGLDEPRWVAGVLGVAKSLDLAIVEGSYWNARPLRDVPGWYGDHVAARMKAGRAWTITASDAAAGELRALDGGAPDIAAEARLLGYPACCVSAHYDRADAWARLTLAALSRRAGGDAAAMRALLDAGAAEPDSPSAILSARYRALAEATDPGLAALLAVRDGEV